MRLLPSFLPAVIAGCSLFIASNVAAQDSLDSLRAGFMQPPNSARPRVWWHWMNGNISKEGIRKDLLWMKRVGIAGFQNFDAGYATPQVVKERITFMTPAWKDAFRYTTLLADSLGLEMTIAASPGWSETGGPWVPAKDGMKKYVWTETRIKGGKAYNGQLPQPSAVSGPFQNMPFMYEKRHMSEPPKLPEYYKDVAVIAYKIPKEDVAIRDLKPKVSSSGGSFNLEALTDGEIVKMAHLPPAKIGENAWVQYQFEKPITVHAVTIAGEDVREWVPPASNVKSRNLEVSDDGKSFRRVAEFPLMMVYQGSFSFPPVTAKYFRFNFLTQEPEPDPRRFLYGLPKEHLEPAGFNISELNLSLVPRVNHLEEKAGFSLSPNLYSEATPEATATIQTNDVIDLTGKLNEDGTLDWTPPSGNDWNVLRFGYSLTGRQNHPASPEATGLEVDKLNPDAVKNYLEKYLSLYEDASGGIMGKKGIQYLVIDSWEAGLQNWTGQMMTEFKKRRGYDMLLWMPVLAGKVVGSAAESDKFLWDFRLTLGEMVKEYHYDQLGDMLHTKNMGRYTESHERWRAFIGDGMAVKSKADIPMAAMWTRSTGALDRGQVLYEADIRESASVSHLYGQKFVAAESMTALGNSFAYSPERLKPTADLEMACGLNRFVIHTSVHQPVDSLKPGIGLGPYGQWFTRQETWAEQAKPWMDYLSRNCFMLQQGKVVADVLWYYGQDNNVTSLYGKQFPDMPQGYNFDYVNADAIINLLGVKDGRIISPAGGSYRVLYLSENSRYMSLDVLRKIKRLVNEGAVIAGHKPTVSPGLKDSKEEFATLISEIWDGKNKNVYEGHSLETVLNMRNIPPDLHYTKEQGDTLLRFVHRKTENAEWYWVNNRNNRSKDVVAGFRTSGKEVEIWHPATGKMHKSSFAQKNGVTEVPLHMEPNDAFLVVFTTPSNVEKVTIPVPIEKLLTTIDGSWNVRFEQGRGAPSEINLDKLGPLSENATPGVKYFSGTATYSKKVDVKKEWLSKKVEVWMDLGAVSNVAVVKVNGKPVDTLWTPPFKTNIAAALKPGSNQLEIAVTNLWVNRIIGDRQPDNPVKITYTTIPFYSKDDALLRSGLIGPVSLIKVTR